MPLFIHPGFYGSFLIPCQPMFLGPKGPPRSTGAMIGLRVVWERVSIKLTLAISSRPKNISPSPMACNRHLVGAAVVFDHDLYNAYGF